MRKKFISIALTLVMVLSLFPVSALAAETDPVVAGYGFLWDQPNDSTELVEGATKGADWMGETMYVYLSNAGSTSTNLWFQVTENNKVWGCAATGKEGPCTYAFSFLNRTSQWEQYPKLTGDNAEFGSEKPHATEYLTTGEVTLKVFTPATAITRGANGASANPTTDELGDPIFEATINIAEGTDVKESAPTHEAPTLTFNKIDADTEILGKKVSELGDFTVAADKTTPTTINVSGTAKYVTGYTQFNEAVADEQEGNYVALKVNKPVADDVTVKLGDKTLGFTDENNTCEYLVLRFTQGKTFKVTATAGDKSTEYTISFTGTLTAKPGTEPEAPTLTFDKIDANTEILGKKVSDLGNFTVATSEKAVTVSGTSNYVTGYEQFNVSVPDEQEGNYVALKVNKPATDDVTVKLGDKTLGFTDENNTCEYLVLRFTQGKTFKVTATASDKSTEYTISFTGTLTAKPGTEPEAPTLTFDKIDANTEILGKKVSDLGNFTVATSEKAVTVSGTSNYVTRYEQFNVSVPDEQEGNYVALKVNKPAADGVTVKLGDKTLGFTDENNTCEYLVLRFTQDKTFKVTATAGDKSTEYTISFNGTLTPKPESTTEATATITPTTETKTDSDGNTTLATTAKVETNKITDAIDKAKKDEAEKDENVSADDVKVSAVTITAKTTETSGAPVTEATVEIPKEVTKVLQENEVKETKIETNVGTVTLPAEVLDKAKEPDGSEATKTLIVEVKKAETSITDTETKESIAATFTVEVKTKVEGSSGEATKAEINGLEKPITLRFPIPEEVTDASKLMLAYVKDGAIKRISRSWLGTGNDAGYILGEINHLTEIIIVDQASISDYYVITEITNSKGQQINRVTIKLNGNFDGTQYLYYQVTNGTGTSAVTTGSGNTINKGSNTVTIDIPATATSAKIWLLAGLPTWSTWTDAIGVEQYDFNNLLTK